MRDHTPAFIMRRDSSASGRERQQQRECRCGDEGEANAMGALLAPGAQAHAKEQFAAEAASCGRLLLLTGGVCSDEWLL